MSYGGQSRPRLLLKGCYSRGFHVLQLRWERFHDWDAICHDIPINITNSLGRFAVEYLGMRGYWHSETRRRAELLRYSEEKSLRST